MAVEKMEHNLNACDQGAKSNDDHHMAHQLAAQAAVAFSFPDDLVVCLTIDVLFGNRGYVVEWRMPPRRSASSRPRSWVFVSETPGRLRPGRARCEWLTDELIDECEEKGPDSVLTDEQIAQLSALVEAAVARFREKWPASRVAVYAGQESLHLAVADDIVPLIDHPYAQWI